MMTPDQKRDPNYFPGFAFGVPLGMQHVLVDGKSVVSDGRLSKLDGSKLIEQSSTATNRLVNNG